MTPTAVDALTTQLELNHRTLHRNVEGVSHEESIRRPDPGANAINWIIGHIVGSRVGVLAALGEQPPVARETVAQYARGSSGELTSPMPLDQLLELFDRTQPQMIDALRRVPDDKLNAKSPLRSPAGEDATFAQALVAMTFHESYHVGQLGMARRFAGKKGAI